MNTQVPAPEQSVRVYDYNSQRSWLAGNFSIDRSGPAVGVDKAGYLRFRNPPVKQEDKRLTYRQQLALHVRLQELFGII